MSRHVVATVGEVAPGTNKLVTVKGREIGIFNIKGEYFALANKCPHEGASLCKGRMVGLAAVGRTRPLSPRPAGRTAEMPVARLGIRRAHRTIVVRPGKHLRAAIRGIGGSRRRSAKRPVRRRNFPGRGRRELHHRRDVSASWRLQQMRTESAATAARRLR